MSSHGSRCAVRVAPFFALCLLVGADAGAQAPGSGAVSYTENPIGGPERKLPTSGGARYGVDINSSIKLSIDADKLRSALASQLGDPAAAARAQKLKSRLALLQESAVLLKAELEEVQKLLTLWQQADKSAFRVKLRESANRRGRILDALHDARVQRLKDGGLNEPAAKRAAERAFDTGLSGPKMESGYNWDALQMLFREEIEFVQRDLEKAQLDLAFQVGVRAQLSAKSAQQQPVPVRLEGYNEAPTGPRALYEKMQYAVSDEQKDLYEQYKDMAAKLEQAKNLGQAVIEALEAEYRNVREQLGEIGAAAQAARDELKDKLQALEEWAAPQKRGAWLASVKQSLETSTEGQAVLTQWQGLKVALDGIKDDLDSLAAWANLRRTLAGKTPPEAMDAILAALDRLRDPRESGLRVLDAGHWVEIAEKIENFAAAVEKLGAPLRDQIKSAQGPYGDLQAARTAFLRFRDVVKGAAAAAVRWVNDVIISYRPSRAAAEGIVAPGERTRAVVAGASLDTMIDIPSIPARKEIDDTLSVEYRFLRGDKQLGSWNDQFTLKSYGWNSRALASLAMARQGRGETWKPTAAMNWILSWNDWPKPGQSGLERSSWWWFSGAGISVMPLESGSTEGVKLGLGATVAFLDSRFLVGIGQNLQATTDKRFVFFSIRVLDFPGLSGPLGGKGSQ